MPTFLNETATTLPPYNELIVAFFPLESFADENGNTPDAEDVEQQIICKRTRSDADGEYYTPQFETNQGERKNASHWSPLFDDPTVTP